MLKFALIKMLRNKWMVSCLLLGAIVFVAVFSMIPTYSDGVYRHMLLKDLETQQINTGNYPGNWFLNVLIKTSAHYNEDPQYGFERAREFERLVEERYVPNMRLPVLASRMHYSLDRFFYFTRTLDEARQISIIGVENFWDHIDIVSGRKPNNDTPDDVLEFVMSRHYYQRSDIRLDHEFDLFTYALPRDTNRQFGRAVCVGVFEPRFDDPFWYSDIGFGSATFYIDFDHMVERFVEPESIFVLSLSFFYAFDYSAIRLTDVSNIISTTHEVHESVNRVGRLTFQMENTLRAYLARRASLEFMLWILIIPVIIMLVFYIYMVSKLMISYESNEISVLKSRGAKNMQIFTVYALMSLLIAGTALAAGPPLGLFASRVLGLANGFMEFVSRSALPLELSTSSYIYAAPAALLFILVMLIPALRASRDSIVISKQKKSRRTSAPLWQKLWLDVILIGLSVYSLYLYRVNAEIRATADIAGMGMPVDPLILAASSMFVLGAGLVFLRLFPLLVKLIYMLGKNLWSPTLYTTLLSVSRLKGSNQFLALFLVFNIGLGLFNATVARTLNRFLEDRVRYENGADIALTQAWPFEILFYRVEISEETGEVSYHRTSRPMTMPGGESESPSDETIISRTQVREPSFDVFRHISGVESATKVFRRNNVHVSTGQTSVTAEIMGIIPHEFEDVAWHRDDLLPIHINHYLNIMTADPSAVFLSSSLRDQRGFRVGDHVKIGWREQSAALDCTVYGFVDFWPSINPVTQPYFIIANLNTIHRQMRVEPYSVWMRISDDTSSLELYKSINEAEIRVTGLSDTRQDLIAVKNDPLLQGLNGTLTLGFIVTLCITLIGYLIYWVLSIRSRLLQFGVLRAMGLSRSGLIASLVWEQLLVSGSAIIAGFGVGILASHLFVPTLQFIYSASEQVPPFLTTANRSDYVTLLSAFGAMLAAGLIILTVMIRRFKIDQILKLGED